MPDVPGRVVDDVSEVERLLVLAGMAHVRHGLLPVGCLLANCRLHLFHLIA